MTDFTSAAVFITSLRGEILLQHREENDGSRWPGHWVAPGGHREAGESPYDNARRELREETALDIEGLLPFDQVPHPADSGTVAYFHAIWEGDPDELVCGEGQDLKFVPFADVPSMKVAPHIADYVRQLEGHLRVGKPRVWAQIQAVHDRMRTHGEKIGQPLLPLLMLKVQEEAGEAAQALMGVLGANPRKGAYSSMEEFQHELCDLITAGMIALRATSPQAATILSDHVAKWDLKQGRA
ncbi:NUDIX domain-containing protein [Streptomyces sp. G-G2]|uniref:NUDIX domain-containing protein n=1 Tax=Streptomyces sp. G-G2 TaxID=3046201 RepID=UPI0024B936A1|nr:NUDIX domain-containing protein [Streptomyces sp. G-G2]MDJ0383150.1 NUDIX domain-containing protein [Streptomyces sp. G-G2]